MKRFSSTPPAHASRLPVLRPPGFEGAMSFVRAKLRFATGPICRTILRKVLSEAGVAVVKPHPALRRILS